MQDIAYAIDDSLYLNITNRCTNACVFCIRYKAPQFQGEHNLWLDHEPSAEEILKAIGDPKKYKEIVFCGYGEPLIKLDVVKEVAAKLKSKFRNASTSSASRAQSRDPKSEIKVRINTNGQANLFHGRNIVPELASLVDSMTISLNAEKSETYDAICNSFFGVKAFDAVIDFIKEAKKIIPEVEISAVNLPNINIDKTKKIAEDLGVSFRVRTYYEEKYVP